MANTSSVAGVYTLAELTDVPDPAWPSVRQLMAESSVDIVAVPPVRPECEAALLRLQVTARSPLGAVTLNSGGLLVDHGWLRVYGGSASPDGMSSITDVNCITIGSSQDPVELFPGNLPQEGLVIAHDVLGGVFALNGTNPAAHGRPGETGDVIYFAPDSLDWVSLECGYGAWLTWLMSGGLDTFYETLRWPGWEGEIGGFRCNQGLSIYPFLWSKEAKDDLAGTSRKAVPMRELLGLHGEFMRQFNGADPGFVGSLY